MVFVYTRQEKIQIVMWHINGMSDLRIQQQLFGKMFPNRPIPARTTIQNIANNFTTYGCVEPQCHKEPQPQPVNEERELRDALICASMEKDPTQSTSQIAKQFDLSRSRVGRILRERGYRPYKLRKGKEKLTYESSVSGKANESENSTDESSPNEGGGSSKKLPDKMDEDCESEPKNENVSTEQLIKTESSLNEEIHIKTEIVDKEIQEFETNDTEEAPLIKEEPDESNEFVVDDDVTKKLFLSEGSTEYDDEDYKPLYITNNEINQINSTIIKQQKTPAQYQIEYRQRLKNKKIKASTEEKPIKTNAQRQQEYRQRIKNEDNEALKKEPLQVEENVSHFSCSEEEIQIKDEILDKETQDAEEAQLIKEEPDESNDDIMKKICLSEESMEYDDEDCKPSYITNNEVNQINRLLNQPETDEYAFKCQSCPYKTKKNRYLRKHINHVHKGVTHQCTLCPFTTRYKDSLKLHMYKHVGSDKQLDCPHCDYKTYKGSCLKRHLLIHETPKFSCDLCVFKTSRTENLKLHKICKHGILTDEKTPVFKCDKCEFVTFIKYRLTKHLLVHQNKNLQCDLCDYTTSREENMRFHKISKHEINMDNMPVHKCDKCDYITYRKNSMNRHQAVHIKETTKCSHCEYETTKKELMKRHVLETHEVADIVNNDQEPEEFKCDQCDFTTLRKGYLIKHQGWHEEEAKQQKTDDACKGKKHKCNWCSYETDRPRNLRMHKLSKHPLCVQDESQTFNCDRCEFVTSTENKLMLHRAQTHKGGNETVA